MKSKNFYSLTDKAYGHTKIMLDAIPMCCLLWNEDFEPIDCNQKAIDIFGLSSKNEFLDRFFDLSPEHQPCGRRSRETAREYIKKAFETGRAQFQWLHQKLDGELIPSDVTLIRIKHDERNIVSGYIYDLRKSEIALSDIRKANDRIKIMLDATPLCCNLWDKDYNNIDCNQEAVNLFELSSKREYLDRFFDLSPEYQPCGTLSSEKALAYIQQAFQTGRVRFEWMHQKLNGEPMPSEITLVRVKYGELYIVAGYTRDLRELKATLAETRKADERTKIMLDATPLCCSFWDENYNNIDCNQEAVNLFEMPSRQEYLDRFFDLSPEYQPDGALSIKKYKEKIKEAFETGRVCFEWMCQKLDKEPIPSEITLVRVKHGEKYIVACYIRDLRELKNTIVLLNNLEKIAFTDSLTGAYNRYYFIENAKNAFLNTKENEADSCIILLDLDHFKSINDNYGHIAGDEVLRTLVKTVQGILRPYDLFARYGGEEFIIFIPKSPLSSAVRLAKRIREVVANTKFTYKSEVITVTISLGVASRSEANNSFEEVVYLADKALYRAKNNGRNRVES